MRVPLEKLRTPLPVVSCTSDGNKWQGGEEIASSSVKSSIFTPSSRTGGARECKSTSLTTGGYGRELYIGWEGKKCPSKVILAQ